MKRLIFLIFLACSSFFYPQFIFADDSYRSLKDIQESIKTLNAEKDNIQQKWAKFFEENGKIQEFLKTNLSDDDSKVIEAMISSYTQQKWDLENQLAQASKEGTDTSPIKGEILKLKLDLYKQFVPYIQISKLDEYLNFIKWNIAIVRSDKEIKDELYRQQKLYDKKVDSLREKIEENKKSLDEKIRVTIEQRIGKKISDILQNSDFLTLKVDSKLSVFQKILEKVKERKDALTVIKEKTTIVDKKIELFELFQNKIEETIQSLQK